MAHRRPVYDRGEELNYLESGHCRPFSNPSRATPKADGTQQQPVLECAGIPWPAALLLVGAALKRLRA
jgi:hypothetical protein